MTNIAWISPHEPLKAQVIWLEERFGNYNFYEFKDSAIVKGRRRIINTHGLLELHSKNHSAYLRTNVMINLLKQIKATHAAVVLPHSIIGRLVEKEKNVIFLYPVMDLVHECLGCTDFTEYSDVIARGRHLRFRKFVKIKELRLVLEDL